MILKIELYGVKILKRNKKFRVYICPEYSGFWSSSPTARTSLAGYYPSNGGFDYSYETSLPPGTAIQRYGSEYGSYAAPYATDPFSLSLPYDKIATTPSYYIVNQSVNVIAGPASPWFGQYGGGIQYQFLQSIYDLIDQGIISPL